MQVRFTQFSGPFTQVWGGEKALPLGELSPKVTERARTLAGTRRRGDSIALTKGLLIAVSRLSGDGLALSVIASQCHLSQRERHWQVGQASLRTTSQSASQTAPLVGEPVAKRQGFPVCQGLPSIGEVARRRRDGEVIPAAAHGQAQKSPGAHIRYTSTFIWQAPHRHACCGPSASARKPVHRRLLRPAWHLPD